MFSLSCSEGDCPFMAIHFSNSPISFSISYLFFPLSPQENGGMYLGDKDSFANTLVNAPNTEPLLMAVFTAVFTPSSANQAL